MADLSDVEQGLVNLISGVLYPNGTSQPSAVSVSQYPNPINCRVSPGWPDPISLEPDLVGNPPVVNVSVYAMPGQERQTQRYERDWSVPYPVTPSFTAVVSTDTVTIGGAVTVGHFVTIHANQIVASYAALANDTTTTVATALTALLVAAGVGATSSGHVITLPATVVGLTVARVGCPQTAYLEIDRTMQRFCATIWAPNNAIRVAVGKLIRPALAGVDFMTMPDGYAAWLRYESSVDLDRAGKQSASCRDIHYWVEYAITTSKTVYTLTTFQTQIQGQNANYKVRPLPWQPGSFQPSITRNS